MSLPHHKLFEHENELLAPLVTVKVLSHGTETFSFTDEQGYLNRNRWVKEYEVRLALKRYRRENFLDTD